MPPTTTLHHTRRGHSGPAVVLLHGLGSSCRDWEFQEVALETCYRIIAVDLPGHGNSAPPRVAVTIEDMADEVSALLAALDEEPAHVVGLSLGACVALRLGLQSPSRVRSLTLVNPFARVQPTGPRDVARLLLRLTMLGVAPMRMVGAHVARGLFPWPEQRALYEAAVTSLGATSRRGYASALRALAQFDARGQVAAIRRPTLVVAGDRDTMVPLAPKLRLAAAIPSARIVVVPASGHATPYDQPATFNRVLLEFLAAH
ncbi:MAG TPA: alpha/beta fold hydrolase [Patescibacteria group bacterium]|jgi:3-oxoadipate enol-lactonase|nr:alpha/beta fold hydrolase [Patescibacteria group bacterium]